MKQICPIIIRVKTDYLAAQSRPQQQRFAFAYTITIENHGDQGAQLLSRHWIITDAHNAVQEVEGTGVIGEQPRIAAGASYRYTSGALLATEAGTMEGSYTMQTDKGEIFTAPIPIFMLGSVRALH